MSLYNKHRPSDFSEMYGNKAILESLDVLLTKHNPPHSFLLTGGTGCGKTTVGRIIANILKCSSFDFRELDSATYRGIDDVREIRRNSQLKPVQGPVIVWLLDECHKLTGDAQNALLKILENPPPHVFFVLCTTDPNKLLPTIRGRCSHFQLNPLSEKDMFRLLKSIVRKEGERLSQEIYEQIILDSAGHPRNAIQILEQVLSVSPENRAETARRYAEEINESIALCRALMKKRGWGEIATILKGLKSHDPEAVRRAVLGYVQTVLLNGAVNDRAGLILEEFKNPFYDSGFPQLTYACYAVTRNP